MQIMKEFSCPSVEDVTLQLKSAKNTELFYNQIQNVLYSELA